jgi:DNA-binding transcriptional regulator GbsR (MarR family)
LNDYSVMLAVLNLKNLNPAWRADDLNAAYIMKATPAELPKASDVLSPWEMSTIELFVRAAGLIGLPRSMGEIYGLLFCAHTPLAFDDLAERLGISRGSVSQGLKFLRQLGAVKVQYVAGSRKDHYAAELSIRRLVSGFVSDQFSPHLESGTERLEAISVLIELESDPVLRAHATQRIGTLRTWQRRMQQLLPIVMAALGGAHLFRESNGVTAEIV